MGIPVILCCDWGTTTLRGWTLDAAGRIVAAVELPLGISRLRRGEAVECFAQQVRPALDAVDLPAILCGMVGSELGWEKIPYMDCPIGFSEIARSAVSVTDKVRIVPGLRCQGLGGTRDVMRGEETQILGWLMRYPDRKRGRYLVCHPGTHTKWVLVQDGCVVRFITAMTGEMFAVLSKYSILKGDAPATDKTAFEAGLIAAGDGGALAARLFSARSRVVGGGESEQSTPSYLSGFLIGAEVAGLPSLLGYDGMPVVLLGDTRLCDLYRHALERRNMVCEVFDGTEAAISGLLTFYKEVFA